MKSIEALAGFAVLIGSLLWFLSIIRLGFKRIVKKQMFSFIDTLPLYEFSSKHRITFSLAMLVMLMLFLFGNNTFLAMIGRHSLEDEIDGTFCYFVELNSENVNDITLPAQIRIEADSKNDGSVIVDWREYYLERVFFPNGDVVDFRENIEGSRVARGITLFDQNGVKWECNILNQHANDPRVVETAHFTVWQVIELVLLCGILLYNWLGCFLKIKT